MRLGWRGVVALQGGIAHILFLLSLIRVDGSHEYILIFDL